MHNPSAPRPAPPNPPIPLNPVAAAFGVTDVRLQATINAPREHVWQTLTHHIHHWWPRELLVNPDARAFILEPRPGGRAYEDWGNDAGLLWYNVLAIQPPQSLLLLGTLAPPFGGPAMTILNLALANPAPHTTTLTLSDSAFGRVNAAQQSAASDGWTRLITSLKTYAESTHAAV